MSFFNGIIFSEKTHFMWKTGISTPNAKVLFERKMPQYFSRKQWKTLIKIKWLLFDYMSEENYFLNYIKTLWSSCKRSTVTYYCLYKAYYYGCFSFHINYKTCWKTTVTYLNQFSNRLESINFISTWRKKMYTLTY